MLTLSPRRARPQFILPLALGWFCTCAFADTTEQTLSTFYHTLAKAAELRTQHTVRYDGQYMAIAYPNGDVPAHLGVCTDVVVRSYRALGIDLQQRVHEDIADAFDRYPAAALWGQTKPDTNIDHRRVPNLATFFARHGESLPVSERASDYQPGDIVAWRLPNNRPHIGIVSSKRADSGRPLVVHNIGFGPKLDDMLFQFSITGHFRYSGEEAK